MNKAKWRALVNAAGVLSIEVDNDGDYIGMKCPGEDGYVEGVSLTEREREAVAREMKRLASALQKRADRMLRRAAGKEGA